MPEAKRKVVALRGFYDKAADENRKAGDEFEVTPARLRQLNACGPEQGGAPLVRERPAREAEGD